MRFWARRSLRQRQRGSTTVEFALVLPLFALVLFGVIDAGRLVVSQVMLNYAVSVGSRMASVSNTTAFSNVQTAVANAASLLSLNSGSVHFAITTGGVAGAQDAGFGSRAAGQVMRVYTTYSYKPLIIMKLGNHTINASAQTVIQ
jgi:Flp pilus assembly protein TadG